MPPPEDDLALHAESEPAPAIERLAPIDVPDVLTFLHADPVLNVYPIALVLRDALGRARDEWWGARRAGRLTALLYCSGHSGAVLPVGDDFEALTLLAEAAREHRALLPRRFQVIGTRAALAALLRAFPGDDLAPRLTRDQQYLSLRPAALLAGEPLPELRPARREDYALLYESGARLRLEELLEDPREIDPVIYARRVEEDCRDQCTWVWRDARGLCFRASVSALTADAAQISGVYTPPEWRGQGIARRALRELSVRLFARTRAMCLFVNDVNAPARAVYARLGFVAHASWASAFFDAGR